jgi:ribosomal protein L33
MVYNALIIYVFSVIAAKLFSSAGTGFTYTFRRPRTSPKFELRKFDPIGMI